MESNKLLQSLRAIVGNEHVLTNDKQTRQFRKGYRFGDGRVFCVLRPKSLVEQWRILKEAVKHDKIIIMQAANTGLTGGSTPDGNNYDRDIIIISTLRIKGIQLINNGGQVVCLPGATLDELENQLKPFGREPHSVIGSSCIGASVHGGVCNNSGGSLVRRGPAYTELALYAQVNKEGELELVNHLGIRLGMNEEEILNNLENGNYKIDDIINDASKKASDDNYQCHVKDVDAVTPARFNADPSRHYEASGSAGKLSVFAVRLDTFKMEKAAVFYVGSNQTEDLTAIRRQMLSKFEHLPIAGEYIHRDAFDIGAKYGKDTFMLIDKMGTSYVPKAFAIKSRIDAFFEGFGLNGVMDNVLQFATNLLPNHLPKRMMDFHKKYEHHLLIKVELASVPETKKYLEEYFAGKEGSYFECDADEAKKAFLHRFAVAGAAIRYRETHKKEVSDIVALDIALRRNDQEWFETLPQAIEDKIISKLYYGHFFCHVFHQDYVIKKGNDPIKLEHEMWALLDDRGAQYPAEHNFGHLYKAKPELESFYQELDPCNVFNPGIGQTSKKKFWGKCC